MRLKGGQPNGSALTQCRGIAGSDTTTDLVMGYQPVLMQRTAIDGNTATQPGGATIRAATTAGDVNRDGYEDLLVITGTSNA